MGAGLNPGSESPGYDGFLDRWAQLHGGYDARASRLVNGWLSLIYVVARPLAAGGIAPDAITFAGLVAGSAVAGLCGLGGVWLYIAVLVVVVTGLLDGLDGAVAVLRGRTTRWGYVLDSVVDRLVDGAYVLAFYLLGAPGLLCVGAWLATFIQEYTRARATAAGMSDIGVVTVWERPTRVITTALFVLGAALYDVVAWATAGAAASAALGLVGCAQLLVVVRRRLRP